MQQTDSLKVDTAKAEKQKEIEKLQKQLDSLKKDD